MAYHYVTSSQPPTSVSHSLLAAFTGAGERNLIIAKCTRLEAHRVEEDGLAPVFDVALNGRLATLDVIPAREGQTTDRLFLLTERHEFFVLAYDADAQDLVTEASGNARDFAGRPTDRGAATLVAPDASCVAMHLCDGLLKLLPTAGNFAAPAVNVRLEEFDVVDLTLTAAGGTLLLAVLAKDSHDNRHLTSYEVDVTGPALRPGPWAVPNVGADAAVLIPAPNGAGVLALGGARIAWLGAHGATYTDCTPLVPTAWTPLDAAAPSWLVGDLDGSLYTLALSGTASGEGAAAAALTPALTRQGESSIAATLTHVGDGDVFVGSCFGDSQSLQLLPAPGDDGSLLEVTASYTSLSPVVDMAVVDLARQGQCQVVTASGAYKDGSLRIVRSGIGIDEHAVVPLPGIKGMWALRREWAGAHDELLVQSFSAETSVLGIADEELTDVDIAGLATGEASVHCATMLGGLLLQVTRARATLVDASGAAGVVASWAAPAGAGITLADASARTVLLALSGGRLVYLRASGSAAGGDAALMEVASAAMPHEVSALSVTPLVDPPAAPAGGEDEEGDVALPRPRSDAEPALAAVCLWGDISVRLLTLPAMAAAVQESLGGDVQARSVQLARLGGQDLLFVGLGDGALLTYSLLSAAPGAATAGPSPWFLAHKKRLAMGSKPVVLARFESVGEAHVFIACDRPTVASVAHGKLNYSNVNVDEVALMCPFDSEDFPECLALASGEELTIGTVDDIQKLHVRSVPLGESPRRIVALPQLGAVAVATLGTAPAGGLSAEACTVRLFDDSSWECVATFPCAALEQVQSMAAVQLAVPGGQPALHLAVGTAYVLDGEEEPSKGRILLLTPTLGAAPALELAVALEVQGGVMALAGVRGRLAASVNAAVALYTLTPATGAAAGADAPLLLTPGAAYHGNVFVLFLTAQGDFLLAGDMMKSVSLLLVEEGEDGVLSLSEVARDPAAQWLTAQGIQDDSTFLVAESNYNLLSLHRHAGAADAHEASRLTVGGEFHLGQQVNVLAKGSLVMLPAEEAAPAPAAAAGAGAGDGDGAAAPPSGKRRRAEDGAMVGAPGAAAPPPAASQFIYGTVEGSIGVLLSLSEPLYKHLLRLQTAMASVVAGVGNLSHAAWRAFYTERFALPAGGADGSPGFVDGDFLELFLELPPPTQAAVVAALNTLPAPQGVPPGDGSKHADGVSEGDATLDAVVSTLEGLSRLH